jgi:hypothetical protein
MDCVALMVALEDGKEVYVSIEMDLGNEKPPENNPVDIKRCVDLFNDGEESFTYIDMYGIVLDGEVQKWEEFENV